MQKALLLAEKGRGYTYPNPLVGALLVKNGKIISQGYHAFYGGPHAEVEAIKKAGRAASGSTLYVTLEPCSTFGKTPPCTRLAIERGIRHVVIATRDPNPLHSGRGIEELRKVGVRVTKDVLAKEAAEQNEVFLKWIRTGFPFVTLKMAETLDGKIATPTGESRWITGKKARRFVHQLRAVNQAVLVGKRTALIDNPRLNVNFKKAIQPVRVVIDPMLELPLTLNVFRSLDKKVLVATRESSFKKKFYLYDRRGIGLLAVKARGHELDLRDLLFKLARMEMISVLVEGGGETAARFLEDRLVDKIYFFLAPKILGGAKSKTSVEGCGIKKLEKAIQIRDMKLLTVGEDFLFQGYPRYKD